MRSIISLLVSNIYRERSDSSYALEYQIDLSSYFRLPDNTVEESSQAPINIDDDVCEFTLQGSGLEGNEVKVVVSIRAALKIYEHNHRSAVLTIKEIHIPSTDAKDADLMTSVLSFEPSGVVFSDDSVDGELSSGDYITVTTPTLMTWDANWTLDADEVSDALSVGWKENEGDDVWQTCQYGKDFNGIIDINKKKADTRIIATYCIKHFCFFSCFRKITGLTKQAYALCVMSKGDIKSKIFNIQCIICYEHPCRSPSIVDNCFSAYQDFSFYGDPADLIPAEFIFTEYKNEDSGYHLKPSKNDTKVIVQTILPKYEYISSLIVNAGSYNLTKGSYDEGVRARIALKPNKLKAPNSLKINVKSVPIFIPLSQLSYSFKCAHDCYN